MERFNEDFAALQEQLCRNFSVCDTEALPSVGFGNSHEHRRWIFNTSVERVFQDPVLRIAVASKYYDDFIKLGYGKDNVLPLENSMIFAHHIFFPFFFPLSFSLPSIFYSSSI